MKDNDLLKVIRGRRSTLRFKERAVSDDALEAILEAGRWAPSYINSQPWEFIVIRAPKLRARVADIMRRLTISWEGFAQAPVLIIVAVNASTDPRHHVQDGAAAAQNMALMAHSLGLASLWVAIYGETDACGTPEDEPRPPARPAEPAAGVRDAHRRSRDARGEQPAAACRDGAPGRLPSRPPIAKVIGKRRPVISSARLLSSLPWRSPRPPAASAR